MTACINLVGTRCKNGDHDSLLRWYSDHVHLLLGFPALSRATLYRQLGGSPTTAPEYVCLYEFPGHADFLAFEQSAARERARQVVETGWAREGIEITQRSQHLRLGARAAGTGLAGDGTSFVIQSMVLGPAEAHATARWLSDSLHRALDREPNHGCAWYRGVAAEGLEGDALVVAQLPAASLATVFAPGWWHGAPGPELLEATPQPVTQRWQAPYRRVLQWRR